uniref:Metalloendopeptidase n=1 Tax=Meloidogyne javanica TaxID=6303 RepID=A0A915MEZ2_MELJA
MKIFEKPEDSSSISHFNSPIQSDVNAVDILDSFSAEEGTNSTCLTILITAKSLQSGVVGLANIGDPDRRGVCAVKKLNNSHYMNTALVTVRRRSDLMITRVVDLVLAHELGHSWGSIHDDEMQDECVPKNSRDGRFVMWESANTGYDKNNYQFSSCSIRSIHRVLYSLAHRCFVEEKKAFCGNGILEEGEQCDGGAHFQHFGVRDDCCTKECKLRLGAFCSPRHSECCSLDCTFLSKDVVCHAEKNDMCKAEANCSGVSEKCPNPKPLEDGTNCTDGGKCLNGDCIPFCHSISSDLMPCLCEDAKIACQRCCRSITTGKFLADYIVFIVVAVSLMIWCPCGALIVYKDRQEQNELIQKRLAAQKNVQILNNESNNNSKQSFNKTPKRSYSINEITNSTIEEDKIKPSHSSIALLRLKNEDDIKENIFNSRARHRNEWKTKNGDIDGVDEVLLKQLSDPNIQFNALKNHQLIWSNGIVPYELDEAFSISEVKLLQKAFRIYRRRTFGCIHFKPRNFENDYLNIVRVVCRCYSQVGKTGGKQELSLGQGCLFNETIIHELMHSLGFWHEHSRADRDNHIIIRWENILPGLDSQFDIFTNIIGTSFELSELDIEKIMKLYNCNKQKKGNTNYLIKKRKINGNYQENIENKFKKKLRKKLKEENNYLLKEEEQKECNDYFVDCNQFTDYCRRISFYFIMRTYCPFTCGKCKK